MAGYSYDPKSKRYRNKRTGQFIKEDEMRRLAQVAIDKSAAKVDRLADELVDQKISPKEWQVRTALELKEIYTQSFLLGIGGLKQMENADYGVLGAAIRSQYNFLRRFSRELATKQFTEAQFKARLKMYVAQGNGFYQLGRAQQHSKDSSIMWERRIRTVVESCSDCIVYESMGWVPFGTLPRPTYLCACKSNCKCIMEFSSAIRRPARITDQQFGWIGNLPDKAPMSNFTKINFKINAQASKNYLLPAKQAIESPVEGLQARRFSFSAEDDEQVIWSEIGIIRCKLRHNRKSVNLDRAKKKAVPVLFNHNRSQHLGRIDEVIIDESKGMAECIALYNDQSPDPFIAAKLSDIDAGVLNNVSFMYYPYDFEQVINDQETKRQNDEGSRYIPLFTAAWDLLEISHVTIPHNPDVGVGKELGRSPVVISFSALPSDYLTTIKELSQKTDLLDILEIDPPNNQDSINPERKERPKMPTSENAPALDPTAKELADAKATIAKMKQEQLNMQIVAEMRGLKAKAVTLQNNHRLTPELVIKYFGSDDATPDELIALYTKAADIHPLQLALELAESMPKSLYAPEKSGKVAQVVDRPSATISDDERKAKVNSFLKHGTVALKPAG